MKYILITGTSTGIGLGTAKAFLDKGYFVFGSVRNKKDAKRLQDELGGHFMPLIFDITEENAVRENFHIVKKQTGDAGLSGLINNAGIALAGPLMHMSTDQLRMQFEVNVIGQMIVTKTFLPLLGAIKDCPFPPGKIIFISSSSGKLAHPFLGAYGGSKYAIEGMADVLRIELKLYNIDVMVIGPGAVKTTIWKKESAKDIIKHYTHTDYQPAIKRYYSYFIQSAEKGYDLKEACEIIVQLFEKKKSRPRYALAKRYLKKWLIPLFIPRRMYENKIAKKLGLFLEK